MMCVGPALRAPTFARQRCHAPQLNTPGVVVGIDLGTTSSAIAVVLGEEPSIVPDESDRSYLPSKVEFQDDGTVRVGFDAGPKALASCKRLMGRSFSEAKASAASALFADSLEMLPDGGAGVRVDAVTPALVCSPVDVAEQVLLELLDRSEAQCGVRASKAVLCVPAQFSEAARAATIEAAERTGLEKVRILEEPVAAALAYGVGCGDDDELVMVVDLGGGTLDVSLLRVGGGTAEVLSSAGDAWLGGDDFDVAIARHLSANGAICDAESGRPVDERSAALREVARKLKEQLTVSKSAEVSLPNELVLVPVGLPANPGRRQSDGGEDNEDYDTTVAMRPSRRAAGESVEVMIDASDQALDVAEFERLALSGRLGVPLADLGLTGTGSGREAKFAEVEEDEEEEEEEEREEEEGEDDDEEEEDDDDDDDDDEDELERMVNVAEGATVSLTRAGLESACADLLERLREPVLKACAQAQVPLPGAAGGKAARAAAHNAKGALARPSMKGQRIDCVLRVGAASRMPAVGSTLEALVGIKCPIGRVRPEHAVALGAAVQAGVLEGSIEQLDVFSPFEAALIRGLGSGGGPRSQRERTGEPSGSRRKKKRRRPDA
jgi:actin-like ATPase involved in cell morphogenesis